jgi:hypothetical protein
MSKKEDAYQNNRTLFDVHLTLTIAGGYFF